MQKVTSQQQYDQLLDNHYQSLETVMADAYVEAQKLRNASGARIFSKDDPKARSIIDSNPPPPPDFNSFKKELLAAEPEINIAYRYLSARQLLVVRPSEMYAARGKQGNDIIIIPQKAAWDLSHYIKITFNSKIRSELYPDNPGKKFLTVEPEHYKIAPAKLQRGPGYAAGGGYADHVTNKRSSRQKGTVAEFKEGFIERGEIPAVQVITLFERSRYAKQNPEYEDKTTAQVITARLKTFVQDKHGNFLYNGIALRMDDFYLTRRNDLWVGGSSREALEEYFAALKDVKQPRASFVQGGIPGTGKGR